MVQLSHGLLTPDRAQLLAQKLIWDAPDDDAEFERAIRRLIGLSPTQARDVGSAMSRADRSDRAAAVYEAIAEAYPESASAWALRGQSLEAAGRPEDARPSIEKARFYP